VLGLLWIALSPAAAVTVSKINVVNTIATSDQQRVSLYGLPPLAPSSPNYTASYGPYPYATSTNTQVTFKGSVAKGASATSTVSTVDPAAALSVSAWSWYLRHPSRDGTRP